MIAVLLTVLLQAANSQTTVAAAATKFVPNVKWQPKTVVIADFTCRGKKEQAILGSNSTDIVVAVFVKGTSQRPEILQYSAKVRNAASAELTIEDQDYNPRDEIGVDLPGFRRSKTCKGLNLTDGRSDSAHIYWNHEAQRFDDWVP